MPASAVTVPSDVPTLPNLFAVAKLAPAPPAAKPPAANAPGAKSASPPRAVARPTVGRVPSRPAPLRVSPVGASPRRDTLLDPGNGLVPFDDEVTVQNATALRPALRATRTGQATTPAKDQPDDSVDVALEDVEAPDRANLASGIRRVPSSMPPPLPRAAARSVAAPAKTPTSTPPARSRLWAEDRDL